MSKRLQPPLRVLTSARSLVTALVTGSLRTKYPSNRPTTAVSFRDAASRVRLDACRIPAGTPLEGRAAERNAKGSAAFGRANAAPAPNSAAVTLDNGFRDDYTQPRSMFLFGGKEWIKDPIGDG